jgi:hypothetical protein
MCEGASRWPLFSYQHWEPYKSVKCIPSSLPPVQALQSFAGGIGETRMHVLHQESILSYLYLVDVQVALLIGSHEQGQTMCF